MSKTVSHQKLTAIILSVLALLGILLSWVSSFRLGIVDIPFAWQVNFDRTASAVAIGVAFAATGAMSSKLSNFRTHVLWFTVITAASSVLLFATFSEWSISLILLAMLMSGALFYYCANYVLQQLSTNLWAAFLLSISFILCSLNFLAAAALGDEVGKFIFWSQGNLFEVGSFSSLSLLLSLVLFTWLLLSSSKDIPLSLLFGLGLGIAGPVFFISCLIPTLIHKLIRIDKGTLFIITCAATGALFVVLADSISRLLIGGYSPTLIIPIALFSIPILLFYERLTTLVSFPNQGRAIFEGIFIFLWVVGFAVIFFHLIGYANVVT